jgi:hypothetical protein
LLEISRHRRAQIGGIISNPPSLPFAELLGCGQIDVEEVRIAPVGWELDRYGTRRELRSFGDVILSDASEPIIGFKEDPTADPSLDGFWGGFNTVTGAINIHVRAGAIFTGTCKPGP